MILDPHSQGIFKNNFIRGNPLNPTIGFIIKDADCFIEECRVNHHLKGGVIIDGDKNSIVIVSKTKFYGNKGSDIEITGFKNKCLIEDNYI